MREIKFRAKRIDNNKWAYGGLVQADDYCIIDQQNELYVEREYNFRGDTHFFQLSGVMCDKTTIGQFTGLKDKSGKEIYEGDLIKAPSGRIYAVIFSTWIHEEKREFLKVIDIYEHTGWCMSLDGVNPCELLDSEVCQGSIIGSVYDNPELLKGRNDDHT